MKFYWVVLQLFILIVKADYEPNWDSLDSRPLPQWYDDAKVGIFIHWGVYSVPSIESEWFWYNWIGTLLDNISTTSNFIIIVDVNKTENAEYMLKYYPPGFTYQEFAKDFTAEFFDPERWTELFVKAGAKYVLGKF